MHVDCSYREHIMHIMAKATRKSVIHARNLILLGFLGVHVGTTVAANQLSHIVHIMADDTGWNDLGYKNQLIDSPNIDKLAMEGIRLTRHHAFKVCSPTRASFHTGRYPFSMGLYDNSNEAVPWIKVNEQAVPQKFTLLPQLLKSKGYRTHAVGKWHLGYTTKAYTPTFRGYDTFFGYYNAMTENYWTHIHSVSNGCSIGANGFDLHDSKNEVLKPGTDNSTYEATLFGDRAVELVQNHSTIDAPFFMYLAFHNEHDPHQAPLSALTDDAVGTIQTDTYKVTAALIKTMDVQVGRVVAALNASNMLSNCVIGFSSDNGGPLDHANNWPFRGGKHTFWEGGVRTEAFVWSPRLTANRRGTEWSGLMHVADWFYTYAVGVAGVADVTAQNAGPYPDDGFNLWPAFLDDSPHVSSPRAEVVHMVHSPKYYPGNCTLKCFSSRNCPEAITFGEMKMMIGYVGDPRIVPLNFTAGVVDGRIVPWGKSGGKCGIDTAFVADENEDLMYTIASQSFDRRDADVSDTPDPTCSRGIISKVDNVTCCSKSCGMCGGADCAKLPGGATECCRGDIDREGRSCSDVGPPCQEGPSPSQHPDRCGAPGLRGSPPPTIDGLCVNGCLFNLTSDPTESVNLFSDAKYSELVTQLKQRLLELGEASPPWAAVPEVRNMTMTALDEAKCDAAKRFGAVAPIDI